MNRLRDKVAVITGAPGGIGLATAELFSAEGAHVVGVDLREHEVGELSLQVDLTDEAAVIEMYTTVRERFGTIDVLFNNAGISPTDDDSVLKTDARGLAARAGRKPQAACSCAANTGSRTCWRLRRRLSHQHRLVRGGDGRGHLTDLLHGLQGRRAGDVA